MIFFVPGQVACPEEGCPPVETVLTDLSMKNPRPGAGSCLAVPHWLVLDLVRGLQDLGSEFKNALMKELTSLLEIQQRFSMSLRPVELHQEVQKTLGALGTRTGWWSQSTC